MWSAVGELADLPPNYRFNPAAFAQAAPGTGIGNSSRDPIYGPGLNNFDFALYEDIHFLQLGAKIYS
ncbi:MAG: hypothetical protein ABSE79_01135 [Terriglobia bacterium]